MFLGNNLKNQKLSDVVKNFAKITEKHMCWGLSFNKDSFWGPATLLQRNSGIGVFCELCEIFKGTYFGNVYERLLLKNIRFFLNFLKA